MVLVNQATILVKFRNITRENCNVKCVGKFFRAKVSTTPTSEK